MVFEDSGKFPSKTACPLEAWLILYPLHPLKPSRLSRPKQKNAFQWDQHELLWNFLEMIYIYICIWIWICIQRERERDRPDLITLNGGMDRWIHMYMQNIRFKYKPISDELGKKSHHRQVEPRHAVPIPFCNDIWSATMTGWCFYMCEIYVYSHQGNRNKHKKR